MAVSDLKSLTEIFNNRIFRIPDFQRGYAWEKDQLNDFWDDIQNLEDNRVHYTGVLTVSRVPDKDIRALDKWHDDSWLLNLGVSAYYVIDGQQRLTTSIILLNEILQQLEEGEDINFQSKKQWQESFLFYSYNDTYKSYKFGYEKEDPVCEFFREQILEEKKSNQGQYTKTLYTTNLLNAKNFFAEKIKELAKEEREKIFKRLVIDLLFNFYELDDSLDMYVSFETMNNRGKKLSNMELLKNRLIYLTTIIKHDEESIRRLRQDINQSWKNIYTALGQDKSCGFSDDDFLYDHWIMYFYNRGKNYNYTDFLLKEEFTLSQIRKGQLNLCQIKEYIDSLKIAVWKWVNLTHVSYSDYSEQLKKSLNRMNRIGWRSFKSLTMAVLLKEEDENRIVEYLEACERFNFLVFSLSIQRSDKRQSQLYQLANNYYQGNISLDEVMDYIAKQTVECTDLNKFKYYVSQQDVCGFYGWFALTYFLYEYEQHLQEQAKGDNKVSWEDIKNSNLGDTIEHIFPQTPTAPYWQNLFGKLDEKQQQVYMHSLGNLLLLSRSKNSELQNRDFDFKKDMGNGRGYYNGSYSEIEISREEKWTTDAILHRGMKMLDFMEQRWGISFEAKGISKEDLLLQKK